MRQLTTPCGAGTVSTDGEFDIRAARHGVRSMALPPTTRRRTMPALRLLQHLLLTSCFAASAAVSAAPLTGAVSSVGTLCLGSTPTTPSTASCTPQNTATLTYLDFINGAVAPVGLTPTPGQPGALSFLTAAGDLMPLLGQIGQIFDLSLPGPGDPLASFAPVNPLWRATGTDGALYTYALASLSAVFRDTPNALDVRGEGNLCRNGADCNLFSFLFTTQDANGAQRTTFSLSQSGLKVPEPIGISLLGGALLALGAALRRRPR
jgi:hypothetical protein